jgi:hypothetical protein
MYKACGVAMAESKYIQQAKRKPKIIIRAHFTSAGQYLSQKDSKADGQELFKRDNDIPSCNHGSIAELNGHFLCIQQSAEILYTGDVLSPTA